MNSLPTRELCRGIVVSVFLLIVVQFKLRVNGLTHREE